MMKEILQTFLRDNSKIWNCASFGNIECFCFHLILITGPLDIIKENEISEDIKQDEEEAEESHKGEDTGIFWSNISSWYQMNVLLGIL